MGVTAARQFVERSGCVLSATYDCPLSVVPSVQTSTTIWCETINSKHRLVLFAHTTIQDRHRGKSTETYVSSSSTTWCYSQQKNAVSADPSRKWQA